MKDDQKKLTKRSNDNMMILADFRDDMLRAAQHDRNKSDRV